MMSTLTDKRSGRRQYLVTYSQANEKKFPTRESFGQMLEREFNGGKSVVKVKHWACCRELHEDGGFHYHCAIKMTGVKRWGAVKENINERYGVVINFSDSHDHYISAYRYLFKHDKKGVAHSKDHPNLSEVKSPKTKKSIAANRAAGKKRRSLSTEEGQPQKKKKNRLSNSDIADFIRKQEIKTYTELFAIAETRKEEGENDIAEFLLSRPEKHLRELISKTWFMKDAPTKVERENVLRITEVEKALQNDCVQGCNKRWLECALEVLQLNNINPLVYASSMRDSLVNGRGKFRNMILVGPANCAKTFMFKPMKTIFHDRLFENPSNDKFGWIGADNASVIVLQDFRWNKDSITWKDLLLLLEGETVKLPAPKNLYAGDVVIDKDVAIFATSKAPITYKGPYNTTDHDEDAMMKVRWNLIKFKHQFTEEEQKKAKACGRCFAELALMTE